MSESRAVSPTLELMEPFSTRLSTRWAAFAALLLALPACGSAPSDAAPNAPRDAPLPSAVVAPVTVTDSEVPSLPIGEEPPPPGTHFVDVARATTVRRGHYPMSQFNLPSREWPPIAYRHGLGMRVRWSVIHSCLDGRPGRVQLRDGILAFTWAGGRPAHCGEALSEFETTLPPGNDAVHAVRFGGAVIPLPDVLSADPPRRGLRRSGLDWLDPWSD
jgi:hypothetical protein